MKTVKQILWRHRKHVWCLIAPSVLAGVVNAQQSSSAPPPEDYSLLAAQTKAQAILPGDSVDVPLLDWSGHPLVDVMINGHGPYRFGIETGTAVSLMTPTVATAAGVPDNTSQTVAVDSLSIGSARFKKLITAVVPPGSLGDMDGVLGLNAYYDLLLTLDPSRHVARFTRGTLPPTNGRDVLALKPLGNEIYAIRVEINGVPTFAVFDTQNDAAFWATPSQVADSLFAAPLVRAGHEYGVGIGIRSPKMGRLKGDISIAGVTNQHPIVTVYSSPYDSAPGWNVGWGTLQHYVTTIDQRNRRVRLVAAVKPIPAPPSLYSFVTVAIHDSTISEVEPKDLAAKEGLREGDVIRSFAGIPFDKLTSKAQDEIMDKSDSIPLVIRRGTEVKQVTLKKVLLVQ